MLIAVATHHMPHDVISVGAPRRGNGPGPSSSSSAPNHWYEHAHALMATDRPNHDDPREFEYRALRQSLAMLPAMTVELTHPGGRALSPRVLTIGACRTPLDVGRIGSS